MELNTVAKRALHIIFIRVWNTKVKEFGNIQGLSSNIVLFDMVNAAPGFAKSNTNTWNGGAIPFTRMSKGNKVFEKVGTLSEEEMQSKLNEFK